MAKSERRAHGGHGSHRWVERAEEQAEAVVAGIVVALIEHDHRGRAGGGGVVHLLAEGARAALDERDVSRRETGEVSGLAATRRGTVAGEVDVDGLDRRGHVTVSRVGHRREVGVLQVRGGAGCGLLQGGRVQDELLIGEVLPGHRVTGVREQVLHVDAGRLVAGSAGGPRAAVGVGDVLEGLLVDEDPLHGDGSAQRTGVGAVVG